MNRFLYLCMPGYQISFLVCNMPNKYLYSRIYSSYRSGVGQELILSHFQMETLVSVVKLIIKCLYLISAALNTSYLRGKNILRKLLRRIHQIFNSPPVCMIQLESLSY